MKETPMKDAEKRKEVNRRFRFDIFEWRGLEGVPSEESFRMHSSKEVSEDGVCQINADMGCVKSILPSLIRTVPAGSLCSLNGHSEGKSWSLWQLRGEFRKVHWSPYSFQQDSRWHVSKASTVLLWDQSSCHFQKYSSHWSFSQIVSVTCIPWTTLPVHFLIKLAEKNKLQYICFICEFGKKKSGGGERGFVRRHRPKSVASFATYALHDVKQLREIFILSRKVLSRARMVGTFKHNFSRRGDFLETHHKWAMVTRGEHSWPYLKACGWIPDLHCTNYTVPHFHKCSIILGLGRKNYNTGNVVWSTFIMNTSNLMREKTWISIQKANQEIIKKK